MLSPRSAYSSRRWPKAVGHLFGATTNAGATVPDDAEHPIFAATMYFGEYHMTGDGGALDASNGVLQASPAHGNEESLCATR